MYEELLGIDLLWILIPLLIMLAVAVTYGAFRYVYVVVKAHQVHVVVRKGGRTLYTSRKIGDKQYSSAYFYIPFLCQRTVLPLENVAIKIAAVPMRDQNLAKFACDIACWFNITDPELAAERLGQIESEQTSRGFPAIEEEIKNLIQSIARNAGMKMEIVKMMKDRDAFSQNVEDMIDIEIVKWGMELVDLEIIHFVDSEGGSVVKSLESRQAKVIESETRKLVSEKEMEAAITESDKKKETMLKQAANTEASSKRQIEVDETIATRVQQKELNIAKETQKANTQKVEAAKAMVVGEANYKKEAAITTAEGEAEANKTKGKAEADVTNLKGTAQADVAKKTGLAEAEVISSKLLAEAEGKDKLADAQNKYQKEAMAVETLRALTDIEKTKYTSMAEALKAAKITIVSGGGATQLLGFPIGAESGGNLGAFAEACRAAGFPIDDIVAAVASAAGNVTKKVVKPDTETDAKKGK